MKAAQLVAGSQYEITDGPLIGRMVTALDPTPVADGLPNQRKVLVQVEGDNEPSYILPRQINPVGHVALAPVSPAHDFTPQAGRVEEVDHITDPMDPRLDAFRPDPAIVDAYVSRTLPGGLSDTDALLNFWRVRQNVMLVGDTQSGKTMLVQVMAVLAARDAGYDKPFPVFTLSGSNGVTDFDLFGQPTAFTDPESGQESLVWLPGLVDLATRVGGLLYLDEVNMMSERVTSSLHPVCDDRRQFINRKKAVRVPGDGFMPEIVKAAPDLWIVGTYNDSYRGAGQLNEAFTNRFVHLPWGYDPVVEEALVPSPVVRAIGEAFRQARKLNTVTTPVGTSALQRLVAMTEAHGPEFALWAFSGQFPARDQDKVAAIIEDRSFASLLADEFRRRAGAETTTIQVDENGNVVVTDIKGEGA